MNKRAVCKYCNKLFSSKGNLNTHTRSAKYCLEIRNTGMSDTYKCAYCSSAFSSKQSLNRHGKCQEYYACEHNNLINKYNQEIKQLEERLIEKYEQEIKQLKYDHEKEQEIKQLKYDHEKEQMQEKIDWLERRLETFEGSVIRIAEKGTNTTQINNYAAPLDLDPDRILSALEKHMKWSDVARGQIGMADITHRAIISDRDGNLLYRCGDPSRHTFRYLCDEIVISDKNAGKLIAALCTPMKSCARRIYRAQENDDQEFAEDEYFEIRNIHRNSKKFRDKLAELTKN